MGSLIANAWRDGFATMRRNPLLFTLAFIAFIILSWGVAFIPPAPGLHHARDADSGAILAALFIGFAKALMQSVVDVPCAVAVHRYVLIGPGADQNLFADLPRLIRFYGAGLVFAGLAILLDALSVMDGIAIHRLGVALGAVLLLAALVVGIALLIGTLRFSLVFPAVATDHQNVWSMSWTKTRGHGWMIFGTTLVCLLPLWLGVGALALVARATFGTIGLMLSAWLSAVNAIGAVSVGAALLSGFYRKYAMTVGETTGGSIWTD